MSYIEKLKKGRASEFTRFQETAKKFSPGGFKSDRNEDEYWKAVSDKAGNGSAVIRFLPAKEGESSEFVVYWDHAFKGPTNKWYIEKSRTTLQYLNDDELSRDPVAEMNSELWKQGEGSEGQALVKGNGPKNPGRKRRTHYVSNIYVISDPANPANNGKVFKFEYGKKTFEMLQKAMFPKHADMQAINPFSIFENGAPLNLRWSISDTTKQRTYEDSAFGTPGPLHKDSDVIEHILSQCYSLETLIDPSAFKSYDVLLKRLNSTLDTKAVPGPRTLTEAASRPSREPDPVGEEDDAPAFESDDTTDQNLSFFRNMQRRATAEADDEAPF